MYDEFIGKDLASLTEYLDRINEPYHAVDVTGRKISDTDTEMVLRISPKENYTEIVFSKVKVKK